jgi:ubiquinone/menaquinone biosynthesis C-methylase UbiE
MTDVTASHWDDYVTKHMVDGVDTNRAEWMSHPVVQRYRRDMMGSISEIDWLRDGWLQGRLVQRAIGIGAGHGVFELGLLRTAQIETFDLYDLSDESLAQARRAAEESGVSERVSTHTEDINVVDFGENSCDLVTFYSSLHHVTELDAVVAKMARSLRGDGVLYACEYVGPNRFQWGETEMDIVEKFYRSLDRRLRFNWPPKPRTLRARLRGTPTAPAILPFPFPDAAEIVRGDPTEAVHSEEIVPTLNRHFGKVHVAPMGGALALPLWPALNHDWLFETKNGVRFVECLIDLDRALTVSGMLPTYFAQIVASEPGD